jgi:hypothetical protein
MILDGDTIRDDRGNAVAFILEQDHQSVMLGRKMAKAAELYELAV